MYVLAWVRPLRIRSLIWSFHACTCTVSPSLITSFNDYEELHVDCFMIHGMLSSEQFSLSLAPAPNPLPPPSSLPTHRSLEPVVSATILAVSAVWCVVSVLMVSPTLSPTLSRSTVSTCKLTFGQSLAVRNWKTICVFNIAWGESTAEHTSPRSVFCRTCLILFQPSGKACLLLWYMLYILAWCTVYYK